jgi:hypothetical protein
MISASVSLATLCVSVSFVFQNYILFVKFTLNGIPACFLITKIMPREGGTINNRNKSHSGHTQEEKEKSYFTVSVH